MSILNIVTTKISQNMTEGTFSRGVPHLKLKLSNHDIGITAIFHEEKFYLTQ
jgi:hypothetical protein